jgi:hypothetical protein
MSPDANYFVEYERDHIYTRDNYNDDSDDDHDDDDDDDDMYDPDEPSTTRFNIVLCELHNERLHGIGNNLDVRNHYLVNSRFKTLITESIDDCIALYKGQYHRLTHSRNEQSRTHPIYRNYASIISKTNYIRPEIAECVYLESQECVAILKTIWIRLIQRKWKNIMKIRQDVLSKRRHPIALRFKEYSGRWPNDCLHYPGLHGMLAAIKN